MAVSGYTRLGLEVPVQASEIPGGRLTELTGSDIDLILESLSYTRQRFATYDRYPSEDFRQSRLADVDSTIAKVRHLRSGSSSQETPAGPLADG